MSKNRVQIGLCRDPNSMKGCMLHIAESICACAVTTRLTTFSLHEMQLDILIDLMINSTKHPTAFMIINITMC